MKIIYKLMVIILSVFLLISLTGCSKDKNEDLKNEIHKGGISKPADWKEQVTTKSDWKEQVTTKSDWREQVSKPKAWNE